MSKTKIERNVDGVVDFCLDQIEKLADSELEIGERMKLINSTMTNVWKGVSSQIQYKQLLIKAPDVAKNREIVVALGAPPKPTVVKTEKEDPENGNEEPTAKSA